MAVPWASGLAIMSSGRIASCRRSALCHAAHRRIPVPVAEAGKSRRHVPRTSTAGFASSHASCRLRRVRCETSSASWRATQGARASESAVSRAAGSPRAGVCRTTHRGSEHAVRSSSSPEPSVEPSSIAITSCSASVWRASDAIALGSQGAASRTGISTETRGTPDLAGGEGMCGRLTNGFTLAVMAGHRLLILGGGFGGLDVARSVARSTAARGYWDTLLIDKENFFQFNPLLPAVAVGAVETRHIVYPLREMARHRRIRLVKNKVTAIDLDRRRVEPFDTLVIGIGSVTNWFGVPGAEQHARPFKTLVDAMTLRARVVELFEMAEQARSEAQRRRLLSFVIVGGGVTGVEVAAELIEMARETLLPRYPSLSGSHLTVTVQIGRAH